MVKGGKYRLQRIGRPVQDRVGNQALVEDQVDAASKADDQGHAHEACGTGGEGFGAFLL